jgi:hypothetical protein
LITTARAIATFWNTSSLPALTSDGKLWYGEAPNQPITPYAVLILVSEPETARTTAFSLFEGTYQLNCHHDRLEDAEAMAAQVWTVFNGAHLYRDGDTVLHCLSGEQHSTLGHEMGTDGKDCWISFVELQVLYTR